jgi:hypothetical protein
MSGTFECLLKPAAATANSALFFLEGLARWTGPLQAYDPVGALCVGRPLQQ